MTVARVSIALVVLGTLSLSTSCDAPAYDRGAILREAALEVIVPAYDALAVDATALHASASTLCEARTMANLTAAQDAWASTFDAFERTSAYRIGPAQDMNLADEMGFWPVSPDAIERNLASTTLIDAHYVDALGAGSKGLLAIAYLLWGGTADPAWTRPDDAAIVAGLDADARRCEYLVALADHVERTSAALASAWRPGEGGYATTLGSAGAPGNATWPDQSAAVAALFTRMLDALKTTKNTALGIPIGHRTMMPSPRAVQSPFASASVRAMQANLRGVHDLWDASTPHSFADWLETRDPQLAATVLGELDAADAALGALHQVAESDPSHTFVSYAAGTDHAVGEAAYARIDAAETTLATDVAARLGLTVAFSDMDGD